MPQAAPASLTPSPTWRVELTARQRRGLLLALVALGPCLFLIGRGPEFPMDDTYIHFQYAHSLAERGRLEFNPGEFRGLGTTSLLWALLLAGGIKLGIAPELGVRVLGIGALLAATLCVASLSRPWFGAGDARRADLGSLLVAALFALSGNILWFALSGMETMLFVALGLAALVCYQRQCWWGIGLAVGAIGITRPEGLALAPTLGLLELARLWGGGKTNWRGWVIGAGLAALPICAWMLYCHANTGNWLPTTFAGKRVAQLDAVRHFLAAVPAISLYTKSPQIVWLMLWTSYTFMYVFGVSAFPGPAVVLSRDLGAEVSVRLSIIGLTLAVLVVLPLLVLGLREVARLARRALCERDQDVALLAACGVWLWACIHNLAYFVLLPIAGTGTRYQAINHLILWSLLALGLMAVAPRRRLLWVYGIAVLALVVTDVGSWRTVYGANLAHMSRARIAAARYVAEQLPANARVGAYDIGALRYFGERPIIDLGGLTDTAFVHYQQRHQVDQYLKDRGATHLALPARHSTDHKALFDFAAYLGIDKSPLYDLNELAVFEVEHDLWQLGNDPTANYQPSVRVYEIRWK